jgi:hypothetical protein
LAEVSVEGGGSYQPRIPKVWPMAMDFVEDGTGEISVWTVGEAEVRSPEIGPLQASFAQICMAEVHPLQANAPEVSAAEIKGQSSVATSLVTPSVPGSHAALEQPDLILVGHEIHLSL